MYMYNVFRILFSNPVKQALCVAYEYLHALVTRTNLFYVGYIIHFTNIERGVLCLTNTVSQYLLSLPRLNPHFVYITYQEGVLL